MAATEPRETELKLSVRREDRAALERHPLLQADEAPEERDEVTTYFDTPRLGLAKKGFSLRVRRSGDKRIQTLKSARDRRSLAGSRGEWEWSLAGDAPDLSRVAEVPPGGDVLAEAASGLEAVFRTEIRRTLRQLDLPSGARLEVAFDDGTVSAGAASQEVTELELELKRGSPGSLYRLALELYGLAPFTIGAESKAERGRRLRTGEMPEAVESKPPKLQGNEAADTGIRRIVTAELGQLLANQPAAVAGDVEGVHQMRVGIRRLRTVLVLFGKRLDRETIGGWDAELKRLGQVFGAARDWDVFCTETLPAAAEDKRARALVVALQAPAEEARRKAHEAVRQELGRPALTGLVLALSAWAEPDGEDAGRGRGHPVADVVPGLLDRMARRVDKRSGRFKRRDAEGLHGLRKALKKLHYSVEYVSDLYPAKASRRYLKSAKRLLKLLGAVNDARVAASLAESLGGPGPAVKGLTKWSARRARQARRKLPKAGDAFAAEGPIWR